MEKYKQPLLEEVRVKTDLRTLKSAWNLLKEMNIDGLLTGGSVNLDIGQLITQLLTEGRLNEFCRVVTGSDTDFESWEIDAINVEPAFHQEPGF